MRQITEDGGRAHAAVLDAEDYAAVDKYLDEIARQTRSIDIVFNAIGRGRTSTETAKTLWM